jgi:hypothetical protein
MSPTNPRFRVNYKLLVALFLLFAGLLLAVSGENWRTTRSSAPLQFYDINLSRKHLAIPDRGAVASRLSDVSLIQVLANPDFYDKKPVRIEGYLRIGFEGSAIYLSQTDSEHLITKNGFWVSLHGGNWKGAGLEPEQFDGKYVLLEGLFDKDNLGHLDGWSGTLCQVWRVMELQKAGRPTVRPEWR